MFEIRVSSKPYFPKNMLGFQKDKLTDTSSYFLQVSVKQANASRLINED